MGWKDRAVVVNTDQPISVGSGNDVFLKPSWKERSFSGKPRVNQEMHPDLSIKDRAIIKNFSNSPESSVAYLSQQYPNHDIKVDQNGQLLMKRKNEIDYKVIDPNTGIFSQDILNDVTDVGYDVPASAIEAGAGTLGAVGGAAITAPSGGWGAIPGAAMASGAAGFSNEALRQKIGKSLGIPQDVNYTDAAISGGMSAVSPVLAGAGKARGLIATTKDFTTQKMLPKIGSMMSGVSSDTLRNYSDDALRAQLDALEKTGIDEYTAKAYDKLKNYVEKRKNDAGEQLVRAIDDTGSPVSLQGAKASYENAILQLENLPNKTNVEQAKLNKLKSDYSKYFGLADDNAGDVLDFSTMQIKQSSPMVPDNMSARRAWDLQKDLKQAAKFDSDISPENIYSKGTARDSYLNINQALDEASGGITSNAKSQYKAALDAEAELLPKFEGSTRADSIQKTFNQLSSMDKDSRKILAERLQKLADNGQLDLTNEAKVLSTFKSLGNPKLMPISSGGTTSTSRSIPAAVAGGLVGGFAGNQMGVTGQPGVDSGFGALSGAALGTLFGSPAAMKNYIRMHRAMSNGVKTLTPEVENELARRAIRNSWMDLLIDQKNVGD